MMTSSACGSARGAIGAGSNHAANVESTAVAQLAHEFTLILGEA